MVKHFSNHKQRNQALFAMSVMAKNSRGGDEGHSGASWEVRSAFSAQTRVRWLTAYAPRGVIGLKLVHKQSSEQESIP